MNNKPVAYGMLTFCKNCGEQNPYAVKELTDEEIQDLIVNKITDYDMIREALRKAQEK